MNNRDNRWQNLAPQILAILAVLYTVHLAREVLLPITLAVIFALLLAPLVKRMEQLHLPRAVGALLLISIGLGIFGGGLYLLSSSAIDWLQRLPEARAAIQTHLSNVQSEVAEIEAAARHIEALADGVKIESSEQISSPPEVVIRTSWREEIWLGARNFIMFGGLSIILLFFLLTSGEALMRRIVDMHPDLEDKRRIKDMALLAQQQMSRYLATVTAVNVSVGIVTALLLWMLDFPDPALWGTVAAALRFVPYLGVSITVVLLAVVGIITYSNPLLIAGIPMGYLLMTTIVGHVIDPLLHGYRFSLNPIIVFVWIFFWGWLWGAPGVLLAVPLLTLLQVICQHSQRLEPIAHIIGDYE